LLNLQQSPQQAFINIMAGSFSAHVRRVTVALFVLQLALVPMMAIASDADPEQDFCVADIPNNPTFVNGLVCKDPALVKGSDFMSTLLATPGNTNNPLGSFVTPAAAGQFPGINTLGISMARLDFAKGGLVAPHTHPRATEIIFVVEGSLFVGFVSTNGTLFPTTLHKGDVFVFPRGLLHFELNVCDGTATAIAALNSQNPGTQIQAVALFNSGISEVVLEKAFGLGEKAVQKIEYAVKAANKKP
jgi:quercetin dioxygenase-like cupin family protein